MQLNEKLILLRKQKGLSQIELAEKINVSRQAISKWETGVSLPSTENLILISNLYDIPLDSLISRVSQLNEENEKTLNASSEKKNTNYQILFKKIITITTIVVIVILGACLFVEDNIYRDTSDDIPPAEVVVSDKRLVT